jgi:hypothetical protein
MKKGGEALQRSPGTYRVTIADDGGETWEATAAGDGGPSRRVVGEGPPGRIMTQCTPSSSAGPGRSARK